jgi:hypothetical protein
MALLMVLIGAVVSLDLMFNAGRNQKSVLLMILFTIWVVSPFIALMAAQLYFKRWLSRIHIILYWVMVFLSILSVISYAGVFNLPGTKTAFMFLVVPFFSWLVIGIVFLIAKRRSRKGDGVH